MFDPDIQFATQTDTSQLLAEIGIDPAVVCEVIADDRAMRCPDRDTVLRGGATAIRDTAMPFEDVLHDAAPAGGMEWRRAFGG